MSAKITSARARLVDLAVETIRTDAVQSFVKQETIFVFLETSDGARGVGYSYTIGTGGRAVLSLLQNHLLPLVVGRPADRVEAMWGCLFASTRATTTGAITSLALAAVDTAMWDIASHRAGVPLWKLAGGYRSEVPLYDTEGGWLHLPTEALVDGAIASQRAGMTGAKLKIGKARGTEDYERLRAVREAVGPDFDVMVDANQSLTGAEAVRRAQLFEPLDLAWLEEPLPADDIDGHARLARSTSIPVAVGESMYSLAQFREYLHRGAASIVQVDVARVGGITPWLKVAHVAESFNVDVCPHFLMELHVSLVAAIPNGRYVEHIPQLRAVTLADMQISGGNAVAPSTAGLGIEWDLDAIDDKTVA